MRYFLSVLLLVASPVSVFAGGWWLDESCTKRSNADKIASAITDAFKLAEDTYNSKFKTSNIRDEMDDDEKRLFDLLIGGDNGEGFEAKKSYMGVGTISARENDEDQAFLKIYCDLNWMKPIKVDNQPFLRATKGKFAIAVEKAKCDAAQAWTMGSGQDKVHNVIQLCPWFAEKIDDNVVPQQDRGLGNLYKFWVKLGAKLRIYKGTAQIDMLAFPYTTIFHELMHTHQGKNRDDTGGNVESYMWNNVVKLGAKPRNYQNADNLMYFALALQLKREGRFIVQNNGNLTPIDP